MTPAERLAALVKEYPPSDPDSVRSSPTTPKFVLVERSNHDGSFYLTGHGSKRGAASYWSSQEYPMDWSIVKLVDLRDGTEYEPIPSVQFEEVKS